MSELQEVKLPTNTTVTRAFSSVSEEDTKCEWVNEKGERIGERCGRPTFGTAKYCAAHTTVDLKRKKLAKREKVQVKEVELSLDDIKEDSAEEEEQPFPEENHALVNRFESKTNIDEEIVSIIKVFATILAHIRLK